MLFVMVRILDVGGTVEVPAVKGSGAELSSWN
jgi:hypothetical protein